MFGTLAGALVRSEAPCEAFLRDLASSGGMDVDEFTAVLKSYGLRDTWFGSLAFL